MRVVQCPVAVDEGVLGLTCVAATGQEAVAVTEGLLPIEKRFAEVVGGVVVMVKMDFDFAEAGAA